MTLDFFGALSPSISIPEVDSGDGRLRISQIQIHDLTAVTVTSISFSLPSHLFFPSQKRAERAKKKSKKRKFKGRGGVKSEIKCCFFSFF
jgi:hypothetical protein